jgi:hypothetical protein
MRMPANASEENENDFRLFTRRVRRCRVAVLLDLRPTAARAILAPIPTWLCTKGARPKPGALSYPARVRRTLAAAHVSGMFEFGAFRA